MSDSLAAAAVANVKEEEEQEAAANTSAISERPAKLPKLSSPSSSPPLPPAVVESNLLDHTTTMTTTPAPPPPLASSPTPPLHVEPTRFYFATEHVRNKDEDDVLTMVGITNDKSDENAILLIQCKTLFSQQLPKMPKEYIIRLLFDRSHRTICCLNAQRELIGAISVKPFAGASRFFEIAFLAVNASQQVRGVGSLLMNHLKEYAKQVGITHFLTYADNFAVGYFKKQGFSAQLTLAKERWFGQIKDYDGGTLMECRVQYDVDNLAVRQLVQNMQRKYLTLQVDDCRRRSVVYPGLGLGFEIKDAYADIPGVTLAGWVKPDLDSPALSNAARVLLLQQLQGEELRRTLASLLDRIVRDKEASWPFLEPVPLDLVVDYLQIIRTPMDLGLIRERIPTYQTASEMRSDLQLVCDNCLTYNHPDTTYYKAALALQAVCTMLFADLPFDKQQVLAEKPANVNTASS